jgi:hypothetical protein
VLLLADDGATDVKNCRFLNKAGRFCRQSIGFATIFFRRRGKNSTFSETCTNLGKYRKINGLAVDFGHMRFWLVRFQRVTRQNPPVPPEGDAFRHGDGARKRADLSDSAAPS